MKLLDYDDYSGTPVPGFSIDLLKFRKRSVVIITVDKNMSTTLPSIMVSIGPLSLFELSLGLIKYFVSISIWDKHYDY